MNLILELFNSRKLKYVKEYLDNYIINTNNTNHYLGKQKLKEQGIISISIIEHNKENQYIKVVCRTNTRQIYVYEYDYGNFYEMDFTTSY